MSQYKTDAKLREKLLDFALKAGAQQADCLCVNSQSIDVSVREGALEDAERAESYAIGLRVFKGARQAYGSTADMSDEGLKALAQQLSAMADVVPEDPYTKMAVAGQFATEFPTLDLDDGLAAPDISELSAMAQKLEKAALSVAGITASDGAQVGWSRYVVGMSSSEGFEGAYGHSVRYASGSVIAGAGDGMERDWASTQAVYQDDLEDLEVVGRRAAERAISRLNPKTGKMGDYPVLFDRRVSASLLRSIARASYGGRIAKGTSIFCDKLGEAVCNASITVVDDPFILRGHRSVPFDGEGILPQRRLMVEGGVLNHLYLDMRSAARLGMESTGHAVRGLASPPSPGPTNLWIEGGEHSVEGLLAQMGEGFVVTELMGANISLSTGDYSRGASGFWVEGGKIAYPVAEMTIAGNLKDMFMSMVPADDLQKTSGIDAPSLLIMGMTTATREG